MLRTPDKSFIVMRHGSSRMNEAELMTVFHATLGTIHTLLFGLVSLMSGFLIMSYLVAKQLPTFLAGIVLTLFGIFSLTLIFKIFLTRNDFAALVKHILDQKAAGAVDLPWYGLAPSWAPTLIAYLEVSSLFVGFIGCIAFFVYQRRSGDA